MSGLREWVDRRPRRAATAMVVALGVVVGLFAWWLRDLVHDSPFHLASQLSGSDRGFKKILGDSYGGLTESDVHASLLVDALFALVYGFALWAFLWVFWRKPYWKVSRVLNLRATILILPLAAGGLDLLENILTWVGLDWSGGMHYRSDGWALAVSTVAWFKWFAVAGAVIAAVSCYVAVLLPSAKPGAKKPDVPPAPAPPDLGICCSGGGIRAAAYAAGAFRTLEEDGVLGHADVIAAVSGGAYAAGAYASLGAGGSNTNAADVARFLQGPEWSLNPAAPPPDPHHRYLENDPGGLVLGVFRALVSVLFNVVVVAAATIAVAWPLGKLLGSKYIGRDLNAFRARDAEVDWDFVVRVPARLWLPAALVLGVGLVMILLSAAVPRHAAKFERLGLRVVMVGVALSALVLVPWALAGGQWLIDAATHGTLATLSVAGVGVAGIVGSVFRIAAKPLAKIAPRLGGFLLAIVLIVFAGWVATDAATGTGVFRSRTVWLCVSLGLVLVFFIVDIQWFSMRLMYRSKLRPSFALRHPRGADVEPVKRNDLVKWSDPAIANGKPELLICAAAQQIGLTGNGIPAESFTISARAVTMGDVVVSTADYLAALPPGLKKERTVESWQATTGAAFSSAMGRFGFGSTNALLAALNIDLGAWLPNPKLVRDGYEKFPRVRLPYIAKEILGVYDKVGDEYVFVADGGQWENLGLVELLRRKCRTIVCIDASGDTPGTFRTLHQAIDLAATELGGEAKITLNLGELKSESEALPNADVATCAITYADQRDPSLLLYAKLQMSSLASLDLQRFAKTDRTFPLYSTARQLLSDQQFGALVRIGTEAGHRLAALALEIKQVAREAREKAARDASQPSQTSV